MAYGTWTKFAAAMGIAAACFTGSAWAADAAMRTGSRTSQPVGHYDFCRLNPSECRATGSRPAALELTSGSWGALVRVNAQVNRAYRPLTDMEIWGQEEVWSYPVDAADCEDYALEKRRRLIAMGIPAGNLLLTVLRQANGEGHAVLTVRTSRGDYILDNLEGQIRRWDKTGYNYLKRQSETHAGVWVTINGGRDPAVASVR